MTSRIPIPNRDLTFELRENPAHCSHRLWSGLSVLLEFSSTPVHATLGVLCLRTLCPLCNSGYEPPKKKVTCFTGFAWSALQPQRTPTGSEAGPRLVLAGPAGSNPARTGSALSI